MSNPGKTKCGNVIQIKICPTKISIKKEKTYKNKKINEIMNAFDGLRNSGGGSLRLQYDKEPPKKHIDDCIRKIEQRITDVTGSVLTMATDVQTNQSIPGQIILTVSGPTTSCLLTLNYHLYFPSDNQVISVPPTEQVDRIRIVLAGGTPAGVPTLPGSHIENFVMDKKVDICESKTTQFKDVKAEKAKKVTIADRLETNKLWCYISAFANYRGGHIYYGINDEGIVKGEKITEEDRDGIEKKVTKIIGKMIWPEHCAKTRGQQWDIHFVPVKDSKGNEIPSTFVIVVYIAQCPGGVFTEVPECYHIVGGKLEKMNFTDWKKKVSHPDRNTTKVNDGKQTTNDRTSYRSVYQSLTKMLNNNCSWIELKQASESAEGSYDEVSVKREVKLICLSKLVGYCYRRGDFSQAEDLLEKYKSVLCESKVSPVFEVLEQYLHCAMERCRGDNEKSYEIAKVCNKKVNEIPAGMITAAFNVLAGTVANNLAVKEENSNRRSRLIEDARTFFKKTEEHLKSVEDFPSAKADIEQKMYTNLAMLNLGCSLSGDIAHEMNDFGDAKTAEECLLKTKEIELRDKYPFSDLREIQYDLAFSCLYYRSSCEKPSQDRQTELLKDALKFSKRAERLATDCKLEEMSRCSKKCIDFFQETTRLCAHKK